MNKIISFAAVLFLSLTIYSCSKKTTPSENKTTSVENSDSVAVIKVAVKPKPKPLSTIPKVIVVTDAGAKKTVDGRLYYDLQGKRYWRNNKDGKYYLYNKSMHSDDAYKAPVKKS
ncbi:MAG: hypothetical protein WKF35_02560 [Ferruginibacter sp.]